MKKCILCLKEKEEFGIHNNLYKELHYLEDGFRKHKLKLNSLSDMVLPNLFYFVDSEEICSDCHNDTHYNFELIKMKVALIHS